MGWVLLTSCAIQNSLGLIYFPRAKQYFNSSSQRRFVMGKINWTRVLLGGLFAGFIINIFEYVTNGVVLAAAWDAAMNALGRHLSNSAVAVFIVGGFIGGIATIWLYAATRPPFAAGPKTAALTSFAYWVVGYAVRTLGD